MRRFRPLSIRDWFTSGREEVTEDVELEEITAFGGIAIVNWTTIYVLLSKMSTVSDLNRLGIDRNWQ